MSECPVCFSVHPPGERTCEEWAEWWDSLTSEQRAEEQRMMDRYGTEAEGE